MEIGGKKQARELFSSLAGRVFPKQRHDEDQSP
jgi:hypothetical protein